MFLLASAATVLVGFVQAAPAGRVAVLPVDLDPTSKALVPALIDDIVLGAAQRVGDFDVIGQDDINALLGFEREKAMLGCDDVSCFAQIGGALGVDSLVSLKVARLQDDWVVAGKLIDIKTARVAMRINEFVPGDVKALLQAMPSLVGKLFGKDIPMPAAEPSAGAASREPEAAPYVPSEPDYATEPVPEPEAQPEPPPSEPYDSDSGSGEEEPAETPPQVADMLTGVQIAVGYPVTNHLGPAHEPGPSFASSLYVEFWLFEFAGLGVVGEITVACLSCDSPPVLFAAGAHLALGWPIGGLRLYTRFAGGVSAADIGSDPGPWVNLAVGMTYWFDESLGVTLNGTLTRYQFELDAGGVSIDAELLEARAGMGLEIGL